MAEALANRGIKIAMMVILCIYMYGAMSLKYVSGAQSLYQGIAFLTAEVEVDGEMKHSPYKWDDIGWVYYISIAIFGSLSIFFSFGDIENSKTLQIVTAFSRIGMVLLFYAGSFYYAVDGEGAKAPVFDWKEQMTHISTVFGNTVFVFIYHHSIPGIIYPVRP